MDSYFLSRLPYRERGLTLKIKRMRLIYAIMLIFIDSYA
ncbi:hypothetical protein PPRY_a1179 [Pseudoalteromonas prydzensis ACAM 620]|nr:hypothetical protein [Pseudoalteromonas prydzensis ACAM 620]